MTAPRLMRGLMAAALLLPMALAGCGDDDSNSGNGKTELTFFWWGGEARAKLTEQALALYTQKHPDVTFKTTWQANQGYFDKLATLTAGSDAPDIFQIDDNYLAEYATRNVTLDLTSYKDSGKVDVSKFPEGLWKYGVVDNKLAGVAMGENTQGLVFNKTKLEAAKQELPKTGMTWDQLITWAQKAGAATKIPGTMDPSADYKAFWVWLRQNGKDLYNGNQLAFTKDDVQKWFELWKGARDAKATPTADVIHEGNATDITKQLVVTNKALTSWVWANQMPDIQKNTKDELAVVAYPGDPSAQWARASMYFSVYRGSKDKDKAVDVINFLANDPEAAKILGTDRGLPSNLDNRTAVAATVTDPAMKASIALEDELVKKFGPAPSVPPKGHSTVKSELIKAAEAAQFGTATPDKAAEQFFNAAQAAVAG
ncbi:sugar ABC transporter substrate-binding protein [Actinoplanes ianthinogenes]|uniref:Sugar ABC transporter substrate-binding protein n=1 Tax=Actinoplanes ianthinogenes TaxID=122358 RepID=A0ABM7LMM6_9ACTN|nr:extracellular solute-binding protein [Actinoplanes ianthinogenes]BCJ40537.1 sugar ABC transporter substrate-binding protein [Actinoplanes ianthinogenes]GGR50270.1 sugar ABC transporter substrate-binding protein [Actinoplanes ianthinogenes]